MPYLYGQPFKYELRAQIANLRRENWTLLKENRKLRSALRYSHAQAEELEAKLARIKGSLESMVTDINSNIDEAVSERFVKKMQSG